MAGQPQPRTEPQPKPRPLPEAEPVLVVLPDASVRMYADPGLPPLAADVLKQYPGHTLGRVPDPSRSRLDPEVPLKPGATYYLARTGPERRKSAFSPIPVIVLPSPSSANPPPFAPIPSPGPYGFPPSPCSTVPTSWRSSSIGSESTASTSEPASHAEEDGPATAPLLSLPYRRSALTPAGRHDSLDAVPASRHPLPSPDTPRGKAAVLPMGPAGSARSLRTSLSDKEPRRQFRGGAMGTGPWGNPLGQAGACLSPGQLAALAQRPHRGALYLDAAALVAADESCQIMSPCAGQQGQGKGRHPSPWDPPRVLTPPHSGGATRAAQGCSAQTLNGVPEAAGPSGAARAPRASQQLARTTFQGATAGAGGAASPLGPPRLRRVESCGSGQHARGNAILQELEGWDWQADSACASSASQAGGSQGHRQGHGTALGASSRLSTADSTRQSSTEATGTGTVSAKLSAALDKLRIRGLGRGQSAPERFGLWRALGRRGGLRHGVERSSTDVCPGSSFDACEQEIEFHDSRDEPPLPLPLQVQQGWNWAPSNTMFFSSPFQNTDTLLLGEDSDCRSQMRAEWH